MNGLGGMNMRVILRRNHLDGPGYASTSQTCEHCLECENGKGFVSVAVSEAKRWRVRTVRQVRSDDLTWKCWPMTNLANSATKSVRTTLLHLPPRPDSLGRYGCDQKTPPDAVVRASSA